MSAARPLRIVHVSSDWKWTGPAEPMLRLALAQAAGGERVRLACPEAPLGADRSLAGEARAAGLAPALVLAPGRSARPLADRAEAVRLRRLLEDEQADVVHCWHTRDHVLAWRAARARRRAGRTALVRSVRAGDAVPPLPWLRWLLGPAADGVLFPSPGAARRNTALRGGRPAAGLFGAVDLARFRPAPPDAEVRLRLGLEPGAPVVGVVARAQPHRRFDLLLAAAARLFAERPDARLLVVGRGTRRAEVAEVPARALGIADRVVFAGQRDADYPDVLRAMDVFTLLVPGSDGTCRAALEAAACGLPAVVTRRGALPEIVVDGGTGVVADEHPVAIADAWRGLLADTERRRALGAAARGRAERCFDPARLAEGVRELYGRACALRARH